jgi:hypothetical protein
MKNVSFLKVLEERPLRMAVEPELPRPQIVVHRAAPAQTSDTPLPAILILGLAFCVVYAFMHGIPA